MPLVTPRPWCRQAASWALNCGLVSGLVFGLVALAHAQAALPSPVKVEIAVQDPRTQALQAWWWRPAAPVDDGPVAQATSKPRPAVLLLHGCAGMLNSQGLPNERMRVYSQLLAHQGWHVLALDSFASRGVREICTRSSAQAAAVNLSTRVEDVRVFLRWLTGQQTVDSRKLAVVGWSNGGSTVLDLTHRSSNAPAQDAEALQASLRLAVAFYPGCAARQRLGYQPIVPVVLMVGLADDWTAPEPCLQLASDAVRVHAFPGAYHGFDANGPVRFRSDIRLGTRSEGVHMGGQPEAREQSRELLVQALKEALRPDHSGR